MLNKILQSSSPIFPTTTPSRCIPTCSSPSLPTPSTKHHPSKLLRRHLTNSSLFLLLASHDLPKARAEEAPPQETNNNNIEEALPQETNNNNIDEAPPQETNNNNIEEALPQETNNNIGATAAPTPTCTDQIPTKQAFLDISIDGEPAGRIVIGLYGNDAPAGAARFSSLVSGAAGVSYRRKEFVKIMPTYVQHGGVRSFGVDAELASKTGTGLAAQSLVEEWEGQRERCPGIKNLAGTVGIIVRDPSKPPPKMKLVARQGKLQIDQEEVGTEPNGTEFVITNQDSPELDASVLVIGRVVAGMEVAQRIRLVKTVQENTTSPYFRVAKLIGDKRAVVAERGFNRPYSKCSSTCVVRTTNQIDAKLITV